MGFKFSGKDPQSGLAQHSLYSTFLFDEDEVRSDHLESSGL